jgi:hypothetical protein
MPVLTPQDIKEILNVSTKNNKVNEQIGNDLVDQLVVAAECSRMKIRFMDAIANKRTPKFQVYQIHSKAQGMDMRTIITEQKVLERFMEQCGPYVQPCYWVDDWHNINFMVEFKPPNKPIYNPEDEDDEDREERRHEHDTSW